MGERKKGESKTSAGCERKNFSRYLIHNSSLNSCNLSLLCVILKLLVQRNVVWTGNLYWSVGHRHLCHKRQPRQTLTSSIYHITSCIHVTSYFQSNVQLSKYIQRAEQNISMAQKGLSSLYSSPHASTELLPKGGLHFTALHSSLIHLFVPKVLFFAQHSRFSFLQSSSSFEISPWNLSLSVFSVREKRRLVTITCLDKNIQCT